MIWLGEWFVLIVILGTRQNILIFYPYIISFILFFLLFIWFLFMRSWPTWIVYLISSFVPWFLSSCFGLFILVIVVAIVFTLFSGKFSRATMTKFHRMGILTTKIYFFTILELEIQGQVAGGVCFLWGLSPWLAASSPFAASSHGHLQYMQTPGVSVWSNLLSLYAHQSDWNRAHLRSSFTLITFLKCYLRRCWGLEPHPMNLVGDHNSVLDIYWTFLSNLWFNF